jgi:hypothetical protein
MSAAFAVPASFASADPSESFLALLPAIQAHTRAAFRFLRSVDDREDAEAEVVARTWELFTTAPVSAAVTAERLAAPAVAAVRSELARSHC